MFNSMRPAMLKTEPSDPAAPLAEPAQAPDSAAQTPVVESAKSTLVDRVFGTKSCYNKFSYRLQQAGPEVAQEYTELKAEGDEEKLKSFVEVIMNSKGVPPADIINRKRRKVEEVTTNSQEGWVAWSKAARDEGEDVLLELVESGTIKSRPRPGLPADSKIKYPNNLQVLIITEKIKKKDGAIDETTLTETRDPEQPEEHEEFLKDFTAHKMEIKYRNDKTPDMPAGQASNARSARPISTTTSEVSEPNKTEIDGKTKIAIKNLHKQHSSWDRQKREFQGLVSQSQLNENTQGSKVERELDKIVTACTEADTELTNIEQTFLVKGALSDSDIARVATLCDAIKKSCDDGKTKASGLKAWFKIG